MEILVGKILKESRNRTVNFYNSRGNQSHNFVNKNSYNNQTHQDIICYNCAGKNQIAKYCRNTIKN